MLGVIRLAAAVPAAASRKCVWATFLYKHSAPNGAFGAAALVALFTFHGKSLMERLDRQSGGMSLLRGQTAEGIDNIFSR